MTQSEDSDVGNSNPYSSPESGSGSADPDSARSGTDISTATLVTRSAFGGFLMGLANLVPGISGGTMLLAAGIYPKFIDSLSDVTRCKFRFSSLLTLGCVVLAAGLGILFLAGTLKELVIDHRWVMYSLFIGLTFRVLAWSVQGGRTF